MQKDEFKRLYVIQFLATWSANISAGIQLDGDTSSEKVLAMVQKLRNPPVDAAKHLAEKTWNACNEGGLVGGFGQFMPSSNNGDM